MPSFSWFIDLQHCVLCATTASQNSRGNNLSDYLVIESENDLNSKCMVTCFSRVLVVFLRLTVHLFCFTGV